jgi:hypothetical protein
MPNHPSAALPVVPSCALDEVGRREQGARYARLAASVAGLDRGPDTVLVRFDETVDRTLLEGTLAVERECCPFFTFRFEEASRRLEIGVERPEQRPALAVLAEALSA